MQETVSSSTERLKVDLERVLTQVSGTTAHVSGLKLLAGGAAQEAWALDVDFESGPEEGRQKLVLRRDMGGSLSSAQLQRDQEFKISQSRIRGWSTCPAPLLFFLRRRSGRRACRFPDEATGRRDDWTADCTGPNARRGEKSFTGTDRTGAGGHP